MKKVVLIIFLISSYYVSSQIKIGQPASETIYFLKHILRGNQNIEVGKKHKNGKLAEIVIYKRNQLYYDLELRTNSIDRYIISENKLSFIITEFPELSTDYITTKFNKRYSDYKIDDFYFENDYSHYRSVILTNGKASIIYMKVSSEYNLSKDLREKIKKHKELKEKRNQIKEKREYEDFKKQKLLSFKKNFFNVDDHMPNYSKFLESKITKKLIEDSKKELVKVIGNEEKIKLINYYYNIKFYSRAKSNLLEYKITSRSLNVDLNTDYIKDFEFALPEISEKQEGKKYILNRYIEIPIYYYLEIGELLVKKKRNKSLEILKGNLVKKDHLNKINSELENVKKGRYKVIYQFGQINEVNADYIHIKKK